MRVVLTEQAIGDLLHIARYIHQDKPTRSVAAGSEQLVATVGYVRFGERAARVQPSRKPI